MIKFNLFTTVCWLLAVCSCQGLATINNPSSSVNTPTTTTQVDQVAYQAPDNKPVIPITVLSGFLGSGKTTLLQHLLHNNEGLKIAVVVNDVASVNIDSKLVSNFNEAAGMVELQNGCACCSRSEELLASVQELVTLSDLRAEDNAFDHIVVELSGVADPRSVRAKFQEAQFYNMPLCERVQLDTMVTVVDCSVYMDHLKSTQVATPEDTPELYYREGEKEEDRKWMDEIPPGLLEAVLAGERNNANAVSDLLISQTEIADIILLNKIDLLSQSDDNDNDNGDKTLSQIQAIVKALNPRASVTQTKYGKVPLSKILGVMEGQGVALAGIVDDHRDAVEALSEHAHDCNDPGCTDASHSHSHEHTTAAATTDCADPTCNDPSHSHSHSHEHSVAGTTDCTDPTCNDPSHSHSHSHQHAATVDCTDATCNDPSHSHSHSHDHETASACTDPGCTDTSHSHSHSHAHASNDRGLPVEAGIGSFVYRSRRPFHPGRLLSFLRNMRLTRGLPKPIAVDPGQETSLDVPANTKQAMQNIIRSKGFVWCADSHVAARYWSHAGIAFELNNLGRWWATLSQDKWPAEAKEMILGDFDDPNHQEEQKEDNKVLTSVGDRRQELVLIGPGLADATPQKCILELLDKCVLNDDEWTDYCAKCHDEERLRETFPNPLQITLLKY